MTTSRDILKGGGGAFLKDIERLPDAQNNAWKYQQYNVNKSTIVQNHTKQIKIYSINRLFKTEFKNNTIKTNCLNCRRHVVQR